MSAGDAEQLIAGAAAIHQQLQERAADDRFSGVVRIDQGRRNIFASAYGFASRRWGIPCGMQTRFDTASITKLFTAVAALQQVEAGTFTLDTSVTDYLGLTDTVISPEVTPYHLLTHTSGIADDADEDAGESYAALFVDRPNYSITETADFLPQCPSGPPTAERTSRRRISSRSITRCSMADCWARNSQPRCSCRRRTTHP
jgi:CubicO group peptidase (beta-lactamase class C family)